MKVFRVVLIVAESKQWIDIEAENKHEAQLIALQSVMVMSVEERK